MSQIIITITLIITGCIAAKATENRKIFTKEKACLETKQSSFTTNFVRIEKPKLFHRNENLKNENERETI